jgi:hypothetical protein
LAQSRHEDDVDDEEQREDRFLSCGSTEQRPGSLMREYWWLIDVQSGGVVTMDKTEVKERKSRNNRKKDAGFSLFGDCRNFDFIEGYNAHSTMIWYAPVNVWFDPRPQSSMSVSDEEIGFGDIFTVCMIRPAYLRYD